MVLPLSRPSRDMQDDSLQIGADENRGDHTHLWSVFPFSHKKGAARFSPVFLIQKKGSQTGLGASTNANRRCLIMVSCRVRSRYRAAYESNKFHKFIYKGF